MLWIVCALISFGIGFFTLLKFFKRRKDPNLSFLQKTNISSWAMSYILIGLVIVLFVFWYYIITEESLRNTLDKIEVSLFHMAIFLKVFDTELTINKHKVYRGYYFSLISVILIVFAIIVPPYIIRQIFLYQIIYVFLFLSSISIYFLTFSYIAYKTSGEERKMAIRLIIFPFLVVVSIIFMPYNVEVYYQPLLYYDLLYLLPQILMASALILMYSTYYRALRGRTMDDVLDKKSKK